MTFLVILFIVLVGGGWLFGKAFGLLLFGSQKVNQYEVNTFEEKIEPFLEEKMKNPEIPNYKIPLEDILRKIEVVTLQTKYNKTSIYFNNVTMSGLKYLPMYYNSKYDFVGLGFKISDNNIFLEIAITDKKITLYKGATFLLYFENDEFLNFKFSTGSIKGNDYNINLDLLSITDLEILAKQNLKYWSISYEKKNILIEGDNTFFHPQNRLNEKTDFQETLKFLANRIVHELIMINKNKLKS